MRVYVGGGRVFVFPSGLFLFEGSVRKFRYICVGIRFQNRSSLIQD